MAFLRSSKSGGRLYWRVVESYRENGVPKHRTIRNLGAFETKEAAKDHWVYLDRREAFEAAEAERKAKLDAERQWAKDNPKEHRKNLREKAKLRKAAAAFADAARAKAREDQAYYYANQAMGGGIRSGDAFTILGLTADATLDQAKAAYRRLAGLHHPDRGGDPVMMAKVNEAYEKVSEYLRRWA